MTRIHRRRFLAGTGAVVFAGHLPRPALAQAKPRVIVVGGGPGGATAAKYIAKDSNGAIEVTLVEPQRAFPTCFHSRGAGVKRSSGVSKTSCKQASTASC